MPTRFTLGVGKYAERLGMVAKGKKQFEERGTFGQPYVSLLCMDDQSMMSVSAAETKSTESTPPVSPRHFFKARWGVCVSQRQRPSSLEYDDKEEKKEVETIISEAGIDVEQELMEEVEHVSEDSFSDDEKEHVVLDSVEEGKIDEKKKVEVMEVPDLEEHEKRYKRPRELQR